MTTLTKTQIEAFENAQKDLDNIIAEGKKFEEENKGGDDVMVAAADVSASSSQIQVTRRGFGFRLYIRNPTLKDLVTIGEFAGIFGSAAVSAVSGPLGIAVAIIIWAKAEQISRTDRGNGIYFDVSGWELTILGPFLMFPSNGIAWAMAKPIHAI